MSGFIPPFLKTKTCRVSRKRRRPWKQEPSIPPRCPRRIRSRLPGAHQAAQPVLAFRVAPNVQHVCRPEKSQDRYPLHHPGRAMRIENPRKKSPPRYGELWNDGKHCVRPRGQFDKSRRAESDRDRGAWLRPDPGKRTCHCWSVWVRVPDPKRRAPARCRDSPPWIDANLRQFHDLRLRLGPHGQGRRPTPPRLPQAVREASCAPLGAETSIPESLAGESRGVCERYACARQAFPQSGRSSGVSISRCAIEERAKLRGSGTTRSRCGTTRFATTSAGLWIET